MWVGSKEEPIFFSLFLFWRGKVDKGRTRKLQPAICEKAFLDFVRTCCFESGVLFMGGSMSYKEGMLFSPNCGGLVYLKCGTKQILPFMYVSFFASQPLPPSSLTSPPLVIIDSQ
jgi:hypothetical protein